MWDLPGPGLEPVFPALAGRFLTTAPPGKPLNLPLCVFKPRRCIQPTVILIMSFRFLCLQFYPPLLTDILPSNTSDHVPLMIERSLVAPYLQFLNMAQKTFHDWLLTFFCASSHFPVSLYTLVKLNTLPFHISVPLNKLIPPP